MKTEETKRLVELLAKHAGETEDVWVARLYIAAAHQLAVEVVNAGGTTSDLMHPDGGDLLGLTGERLKKRPHPEQDDDFKFFLRAWLPEKYG